MEIKKLQPDETTHFIQLIELFKKVFEKDSSIPDREYLEKLLSDPDFLVFTALLDGRIAGGLTVYTLHQYYGEKPLAYIYDVGVSPDFQGKGIGKALLSHTCTYCLENGFELAYVEAETDDTDAVAFYRKTGFSYELQATHFTYTFH